MDPACAAMVCNVVRVGAAVIRALVWLADQPTDRGREGFQLLPWKLGMVGKRSKHCSPIGALANALALKRHLPRWHGRDTRQEKDQLPTAQCSAVQPGTAPVPSVPYRKTVSSCIVTRALKHSNYSSSSSNEDSHSSPSHIATGTRLPRNRSKHKRRHPHSIA